MNHPRAIVKSLFTQICRQIWPGVPWNEHPTQMAHSLYCVRSGLVNAMSGWLS